MPHIELPFVYQYSPLHFTNYHHPLCFRSVHRLHLRPLTSYPTVSYPWTPCPVLHSPQVCTYLTVCSLIMMNIKECVYIIISLQGMCIYHNLFARSVTLASLCKDYATHSLHNVFNYSVLHAVWGKSIPLFFQPASGVVFTSYVRPSAVSGRPTTAIMSAVTTPGVYF